MAVGDLNALAGWVMSISFVEAVLVVQIWSAEKIVVTLALLYRAVILILSAEWTVAILIFVVVLKLAVSV